MRVFDLENRIFDTQIDTKKMFVPMKHSFKLRNSPNKQGKCPIYLHITQNGDRERIPLELFIESKNWNSKTGFAKQTSSENIDINLILKNIDAKITDIKTQYRLTETFLDLKKFRKEFFSGFPRLDLCAFMDAELELDKPQMNKQTYKNQYKVLSKLRRWKEKIPFTDIDMTFIQKYKNYCVSLGNATTTMENNVKIIKKFLIRAKKRGIKFPLDPSDIVCGSTLGNRVDLDAVEINKLISLFYSEFINETHIIPLAKFLISCFTGLRISDIQQFKHKNIVNEQLKFTTIKTGKRQTITMNTTVLEILKKCPNALTSNISDQKINAHLKEIAKICGIKKVVTFHVARHSFATNFLRLGGTIEKLQELLGHSSITETRIYVHIVQEELDREIMIMDNLVVKPNSLNEL